MKEGSRMKDCSLKRYDHLPGNPTRDPKEVLRSLRQFTQHTLTLDTTERYVEVKNPQGIDQH